MRHYFKYILIISLALSQRYPSNIDNLNKIGDNIFSVNTIMHTHFISSVISVGKINGVVKIR